MKQKLLAFALLFSLLACNQGNNKQKDQDAMKAKVEEYAAVKLTTDLSQLSEKEKQMLPLLFEAARIMDDLFWKQAYGDKEQLLKGLDEYTRRFAEINYGPWERLNDMEPFIEGVGTKPLGANFYPTDMTKEEFEALDDPAKTSLYTVIRRDESGKLKVVPYSEEYKEELLKASALLLQAADLAEDEGLKKYLLARSKALLSNDYFESDLAWMDMKNNKIDFIIGPIENYEDRLFGYKAAFESFILVKDLEWTQKLAHIAQLLPKLQQSLPVADAYKAEKPASSSDLGAYDAIYYAGDCNSGSKTIAINLPNDPEVQKLKGSRRLQLKNSMKAKFDKILLPIAQMVIDPSQVKYVSFDAFFENVMFHEIAHGLGVHRTINGKGDVREALKDTYSALEEAKADITGLYLVTQMHDMGEITDKDLMDNYVTFLAGIFRSVRFGASSAHGKSNMIQFNYFLENGAFNYDAAKGLYSVNLEKMKKAVADLSGLIITIQGDGDYPNAAELIQSKGSIPEQLSVALGRLAKAGIPRDVVFEQGPEVLGL
ncbi:MAG: hypothetical protein PWR20_947 [Bacteroidales bacterium]|jgi:hypothetical protein|nr:hypothetical protein [Bacteroidales bacterium]MDN5329920.1 hypothetical protein [Bacteroidales bacterium]